MDVQHALEGYIHATNTHDFTNVAKYVSPDAIYWFKEKEYSTFDEIEGYFNNTWNLIKDEKYSISKVNWIAIDQNLATCLYTYHWEGYYNGNLVSGSGNATNIFSKMDNEWKLIHEHLSPSA
ncbi:YybH family protein [Bacillus sp. CGMCC 1.16607]|uniref:YybH family protein n=1 Tax=Bacillus sp. CGMCC 1.16607 TaxID=3351842 RepID=UPI00363DC79A